MPITRRAALAAAIAGPFARPALAAPALSSGTRPLVFVPQANLTSLDPVWTTATVTRNFGLMVYDTLYGLDAQLRPSPQMAEGHVTEQDGRLWRITLRSNLRFHDDTPVRARDCAASLARWMRRDALGQTLAARLDALETPDDRTLVFRLKKPFPALPFALAKTQPSPPVILPERLALTDPFKQITEIVGSGPFRFVANEFVPGSSATFARFDRYTPRDEPPDFTAGAKRTLMERIEWRILPEPATATAALRSGEVDWLEIPLPDLQPALRADRAIRVERLDPIGLYPVLRFNSTTGPTANREVRRAILAAINPVEVMQAVVGDDPANYHAPIGCFLPGTNSANESGMDRLGGREKPDAIAARLRAAGYNNERVVLLHATDQPFYDAMSQVTAAAMKRIGLNVDDAAMDFGTVVQRRARHEPLEQGGWSMFCASFPAADYIDPLVAPALRANGSAAWFGWPDVPEIERLHDRWMDSADPAERRALAVDIQRAVFEEALYVPLGQYFQNAAWRSDLSGHLKGPAPVFWNVKREA